MDLHIFLITLTKHQRMSECLLRLVGVCRLHRIFGHFLECHLFLQRNGTTVVIRKIKTKKNTKFQYFEMIFQFKLLFLTTIITKTDQITNNIKNFIASFE